MIDARCIEDSKGRKVRVFFWVEGPGRGGFSGSNGRPPGGWEVNVDTNANAFIDVVALEGDPQQDDATLYGVYREGAEAGFPGRGSTASPETASPRAPVCGSVA